MRPTHSSRLDVRRYRPLLIAAIGILLLALGYAAVLTVSYEDNPTNIPSAEREQRK